MRSTPSREPQFDKTVQNVNTHKQATRKELLLQTPGAKKAEVIETCAGLTALHHALRESRRDRDTVKEILEGGVGEGMRRKREIERGGEVKVEVEGKGEREGQGEGEGKGEDETIIGSCMLYVCQPGCFL